MAVRGRVEAAFENRVFPGEVDGMPCMMAELACVHWISYRRFHYVVVCFCVAIGPDGSVRQLADTWCLPEDDKEAGRFCRSLSEFLNRG